MKRAVFLDRDGVILDHGGSIFPGVRAALERLKAEGFFLAIVTNQPDIATGKIKREIVDRINMALMLVLPIDWLKMCPHVDSDKCECRKPMPGMLLEIAQENQIDMPASYIIGDRWRDISAGAAAGCRTILLGTGYGEPLRDKPLYRAADLSHASDIVLELS